MKFLVLAFALVAVCSAASLVDHSLDKFWEEFKDQHNKQYLSSEDEVLR